MEEPSAGPVLPQVEPGTVLGRHFRLLRLIGEGGMGRVYEGLDTELERSVAVKVMAATGPDAGHREELVRQEAVLLARLQHPNIVSIHEIGAQGHVQYIVMDLVEGTPLDQVLEFAEKALAAEGGGAPRDARLLGRGIGRPRPQGRASLIEQGGWFDAVARIMLEVARTIEAAHHQGVLHRDLKPRNVMLRGDGTPVVLDFGLAGARDRDNSWISKRLVGSVAYMAPEQVAAGRTGADPRTDVYQLGLMLYELLTLRRAFPGRTMSGVLENVRRGRFERPRQIDRGIPRDLSAIALQAMELDPRRRYPTAAKLREDLERYVTGIGAPVAGRGGRVRGALRAARYALRRRRTAVGAALALAAGLAGGGWFAWERAAASAGVRWFRVPVEGAVEFSPDAVSAGDILGAEIETDGEKVVYALSVWGERDPPTRVAPMRASLAGEGGAAAGAEPAAWGRTLPAGRHRLLLTLIAEHPDVPPPFEGAWLMLADEHSDLVDGWLRQLALADAEDGEPGVSFDAARRLLLRGRSPTRGGPVRLTPEQHARLAQRLLQAAADDEAVVRLDDVLMFKVALPLRGSGAPGG